MESIKLVVDPRDLGKKGAKSVRNAGNVPCVLYGQNMDPVHFQIAELALRPLIYTAETHTVEVSLAGETWPCILRSIDFHPVTDRPHHVDFQLLRKGEKIRITVPIQFKGTPAGQLEGGVTQVIISELEIECLPKDIPSHIEIDISEMNIGDTKHVSDLTISDVTLLTDLEHTLITIAGAAPEEELVEEELLEGEEARPCSR